MQFHMGAALNSFIYMNSRAKNAEFLTIDSGNCQNEKKVLVFFQCPLNGA